ncbi:PP2C-domain-containing protein [Pisolithus croceorrhizus]|nr:PP2C-domain-containing protein [Pisolithus croceorrhizus]
MGQTLSAPATSKKTESGENDHLFFSVTEMQGWRISMEDAHAAVLNLEEIDDKKNSFFAVYDGHGGGTVARFAGQNLHKRLLSEEAYRKTRYEEALKRAFLGTDEELLADPTHTRDPSGCTAIAALVTHDRKIYVANAGDSRSVISVKGEAQPLSFDHKPSNDTERARIVNAGGYIEFGRVNGNLALSRALGDFQFKKNYSLIPQKQVITADPDVMVHQLSDEDEFFVLACDGIWDCLSSQQVVNFIRLKVAEGKELTEIGEMMCEHCLAPDTTSPAGIGCDNMTVLIVAILNGRTKQEWYNWIGDRVKNQYGFPTPSTIPQIYAANRLVAFKARREAMEERDRQRKERGDEYVPPNPFGGLGPLSGIARVLGSTGGISFSPETGIVSDSGRLMFTSEDDSDSEDDIESDTPANGRSSFGSLGSRTPDPAATLRHDLATYQNANAQESGCGVRGIEGMKLTIIDDDEDELSNGTRGAAAISSPSSPGRTLQGETPPSPPKPQVNGAVTPVPQLAAEPLGDKPHPVLKAEGLLDTSESPFKV